MTVVLAAKNLTNRRAKAPVTLPKQITVKRGVKTAYVPVKTLDRTAHCVRTRMSDS